MHLTSFSSKLQAESVHTHTSTQVNTVSPINQTKHPLTTFAKKKVSNRARSFLSSPVPASASCFAVHSTGTAVSSAVLAVTTKLQSMEIVVTAETTWQAATSAVSVCLSARRRPTAISSFPRVTFGRVW
ncbi:hypothetical protein BLNAU_7500 [Blattamonas nauphoetae]|uniref:Uncharacterized protein n=1 Tax=Blattamonas nauphoetae TaxID=2049346 RepID=A0ABQ9Y1H9_9EUKA|nr:hypothetical protein BLNAU_7500 [Blattamonas nauphoetae]